MEGNPLQEPEATQAMGKPEWLQAQPQARLDAAQARHGSRMRHGWGDGCGTRQWCWELDLKIGQRDGRASSQGLQGTETRTNMVDDMPLECEHGANVITAIELDGLVGTGQAMVPLYPAKHSVQVQLATPRQERSFTRMGPIQTDLGRRVARLVLRPEAL